jgi:hypothetical protein
LDPSDLGAHRDDLLVRVQSMRSTMTGTFEWHGEVLVDHREAARRLLGLDELGATAKPSPNVAN